MSYLVDTNVISELIRTTPDKNVKHWFTAIPNHNLYISVISFGEIRKGIEKLDQHTKRKERLLLWLENELPAWFENRVLPIDLKIADRWGRLLSEVKRPMPAIDSLLAATALCHDLRIVTRNIDDFDYPTLQVINPWEI